MIISQLELGPPVASSAFLIILILGKYLHKWYIFSNVNIYLHLHNGKSHPSLCDNRTKDVPSCFMYRGSSLSFVSKEGLTSVRSTNKTKKERREKNILNGKSNDVNKT